MDGIAWLRKVYGREALSDSRYKVKRITELDTRSAAGKAFLDMWSCYLPGLDNATQPVPKNGRFMGLHYVRHETRLRLTKVVHWPIIKT